MEANKFFLSYSRSDSEFVLKLAKDLRARNINLWLDTLDIPKGSIWDVEIEKALNNADFLLAILTPSAVESNNVMDEISYALEQKKIVVPILLKDCNIPFRLRRRQYISFKEDYDNSLNELLNTLKIKGGLANKTREEDNTKDTKLKLGTPLATNDTKTSTSNTSSNTFKYKKLMYQAVQ